MPYQPTTNFKDSDGVDLGKKLINKDYLLSVYGSILDTLAPGLTPTPALWTWSTNSSGQIGINDTTQRNTPVTTILGGNNWKSISSGYSHSAAIKTDGTLWLWGSNGNGELGINDSGDGNTRLTPVTTILGGNDWAQVSTGSDFTVAIKTNGSLWTWGRNSYGELGINDTLDRSTPVTTILGGNNWKTIAARNTNALSIKSDGTLWIWGSNFGGKIGVNDIITRITPVTTILGGNDWKSIATGNLFSAAIKTDGTLWMWGANYNGPLGINNTTSRSTPVTTILGGNNWKSIATGNGHCLAIKTDGSLWTWGRNYEGQIGINDTTQRNTPVTTIIGGNNWKSVSTCWATSLAIKTDGSLWTWGENNNGQLGVNDTTSRSTPVTTILGGNNWKSVDGGFNGVLAIQSIDYI